MPAPARLRELEVVDLPAVHALWQRAIGDMFPLDPSVLRRCLFDGQRSRPAIVAMLVESSHDLVGFGYATATDRAAPNARRMRLQAVVVDPAHRRRGVGTRLARSLISSGRQRGARTAGCGGGLDYLWPGVPFDADGATPFVMALGFQDEGTSYDLRGTDRTAALAIAAATGIDRLGVTVDTLAVGDIEPFLTFVDRWFEPDWAIDLRAFIDDGGAPDDVLVVRDRSSELVAFVRIHRDRRSPIGPPLYWAARRGAGAAGLGPIGVAGSWRGRGLGTALLGEAIRRLAARGGDDVVIDFTDQLAFYGRLGFVPWMTFRHATLDLAATA